jgi:acyl-CoA-dependent ceramide synthase
MNDQSATAELRNEKVEAAQDWLHKSGNNVNEIEHKPEVGHPEGLTASPTIIKWKAKRKDDGPLEIVCGWIVEHQIGMRMPSYIQL